MNLESSLQFKSGKGVSDFQQLVLCEVLDLLYALAPSKRVYEHEQLVQELTEELAAKGDITEACSMRVLESKYSGLGRVLFNFEDPPSVEKVRHCTGSFSIQAYAVDYCQQLELKLQLEQEKPKMQASGVEVEDSRERGLLDLEGPPSDTLAHFQHLSPFSGKGSSGDQRRRCYGSSSALRRSSRLEKRKRVEYGEEKYVEKHGKMKPYEKWTLEQEDVLLKGFQIHGWKWAVIVKENPKNFYNKDRTSLKDKFKNLEAAGRVGGNS